MRNFVLKKSDPRKARVFGNSKKSNFKNWYIEYYGVKVHAIAFSRPGALPLPEYLFLTNAAQHDLEAFRPLAEEIYFGDFIGDRAYVDTELKEQMKQRETDLVTPIKRKRNDPPLTLFQKAYNAL